MLNEKIKLKERQRGAIPIIAIVALLLLLIAILVVTCSKDDDAGGVTVTVASAQQELIAVIDGLISDDSVSDADLQNTATGVIGGLSGAGLTDDQIQEVCREAIRVIRARISGPTTSVAMGNRLRQLLRAVQQACSR